MASSNNCEEMMLPDGTAAFRNSVLKECSDHLASTTLKYERESFAELFLQDEVFLGKLFRLFDHDRDGLLMPDEWIQLLRCRLTPDNYTTDLINQVENLISHNPIDFASFQKIFSNVEIVEKLLKVIGSSSGGEHQENQFMEFITFVTDPILPVAAAGFDKSSLEWLEKIFKQTVGNEREIHREEFKKIVISKNPFFTERVFQIFDKDNSGTISLHEFLDAMHQFAGKTPNDKIRFLFKVYDIDGDGLIQHRELQHVMRACMEENEMTFSDEQIEDLTLALFEDADQRNTGAITFEALKKQLEKHEGLLENLSISIDRWMVPPKLAESRRQTLSGLLSALKPYQLTKPYMKNNYVFIGFIWLLISINLVLFVSRLYVYRLAGAYIMIARACGQCLNFNCTLVLVLTLRQCITFLRTHGFISILPLDHHIYLHKVVGIVVGALSIVHTLAHLVNFGTVVINDEILNHSHYSMSEWILTTRPGLFGLVGGEANPTGIALLVILFVMTICSMPFVRRGGCFEIFYWSHLLYLPFWILLIFHAPNFWKWFVLPGSICMVERVRRFMWLRSQRGKTYISSGLLLPSRVTHLVIKRPQHLMDFCPGDYVFVNVPVIAKYEWHPFTISSAPEQEDYMWLHIRAVGEWTNSLYAYFEKEQQKLAEKERQQSVTAFDNRCFVADDEHNAAGASRKIPLMEKSFSMPDMHHKKKEQLMALRDYARSERSFNEAEIRRARLKAYLTPQNKSLAHSFKYIRNKPTIIAFETSSDGSVGCAALAAAEEGRRLDNKPLDIFLDGPYGAPSSHIFQAQHAVLIATGIGVTPFASILQSIMHRYWKARHTCPKCNFAWASEIPVTVMNLRKVDFFWINRDQRSFEWFVNLLSQLEIEQAELGATMERFLEMHMYITSALQKNDMKAVGLQLAMDLLHEKEKRDLITGLKTRTIAGRPNWDKVFQQLYNQKKGKVTVFYCGPSQLARILRYKCHQFGFHFRKESF